MPTARVGTLELNYDLRGEGTPLLLVMGVGAQKIVWREAMCDMLAERGFRVARFDNRDVGESSRLDHLGVPSIRSQILRWMTGQPVDAPYALDDLADDALGLMDVLGWERAHVVGASMGGMIAQLMSIRGPDRVASLTSIMSHPGDRLSKIPRPRAMQAMLASRPRTAEETGESWVKLFAEIGSGPPHFRIDPDERYALGKLHFERGPSPQGFVRQMMAILASPDRRPALRGLDVPALVVRGTADPLVRHRGGVQTALNLRHGELMSIEGMGHDLPPEVWPRLCDAIEHVSQRGSVG